MGRIDLPDKRVDWVNVTAEYLAELYDKVETLKSDKEALRADNERLVATNKTLRAELARASRPRPYV